MKSYHFIGWVPFYVHHFVIAKNEEEARNQLPKDWRYWDERSCLENGSEPENIDLVDVDEDLIEEFYNA